MEVRLLRRPALGQRALGQWGPFGGRSVRRVAVLVLDAATEPGEPFGLRHTGRTTFRIPVEDAWLLSRGMVNLFPHSSVNRPFVGPGLREL